MEQVLKHFLSWLQDQGLHVADDCFEAPLESGEYDKLVEQFMSECYGEEAK